MKISQKNLHFLLLGIILILGIIVRVYNIDYAPSGIYPDEANNGTNAFDAQDSGNYLWFYPDNNGREGLFLNIIALSFKIFDVSLFSLKLPSIIMGVLTIAGVYFLSKELFLSKPRIALIASYLTATSFWAINFSRIAFRAIMMLPIATFSFYFFLRGIRTGHLKYFIFGGLIFGLGFHSYIAFRIAPVLLVVLLALLFIQIGFKALCQKWKGLILFVLFAIVSAAPIFYTFHTHPEYLNSRTGDVSVFAQKDQALSKTLTHTISTSLLKYNVYGDQNWRHGYPPLPTLEFFVGLTFLCGFLLSIGAFIKYIYKRLFQKNRNRKFVSHGLLVAWFFAFLAPEFMTTEGLPHNLRSIGTLPVVFILAAFFINYILERAQMYSYKTYFFASMTLFTLLLWSGFFNIAKYHIYWSYSPEQATAFNKDLTDIGRHIRTLPTETQKYVVAGPLARLPIQLLNEKDSYITYFYEDEEISITPESDYVILLPYRNDRIISSIAAQDEIIVEEIQTNLETSFIIIYPL